MKERDRSVMAELKSESLPVIGGGGAVIRRRRGKATEMVRYAPSVADYRATSLASGGGKLNSSR